MTPIPLMVELCAGTAALSLRLHRDGAKPPVSRQGAKTGYADALLRVLGLTPGQRAAAYLWCEPDPGVRLLLHAYRDAGLAKAAAAIIRGWAAEDPRALWERLRAEGPPRLPEGAVEAGEVARWQVLGAWAFRRGEPDSGYAPRAELRVGADGYVRNGTDASLPHLSTAIREVGALPATIAPDAREVDPREVARWAVGEAWQNGGRYMGPDRPSARREIDPGWTASITSEGLARRTDSLPSLPATIAPDARLIDPREVARYAQIVASNRLIHTAWSDAEGRWVNTGDGGATFGGPAFASPPERTAEGLDAAPADLPAVVAPDAREVDPREVARWAWVSARSWKAAPEHGFKEAAYPVSPEHTGGAFRYLPTAPAHQVEANTGLPALIHPDAREVDPREVARWAFVQSSNTMIALDSNWRNTGVGGSTFYDRDDPCRCAPHIAAIESMPALIHPDARTIDPPMLQPGTVVFIDPPYVNTTGYAHDLPRAEVVTLARRWAAAGATVAISEAEPIPELVAEGWYSVDITNQRVGQSRTFSKQQHEHVTLNRPPAWVPPVQGRLF